jgi:hypothetical protein
MNKSIKYLDSYKEYIESKRKLILKKRLDLKLKVFSYYSGGEPKCNCCGITGIYFLCIDHINDDGNKIRGKKQTFTGEIFYRWIVKNNFPNDLQVLCYNCNNAKHWNNNICPHKIIK